MPLPTAVEIRCETFLVFRDIRSDSGNPPPSSRRRNLLPRGCTGGPTTHSSNGEEKWRGIVRRRRLRGVSPEPPPT
ncbi:hypothetical protein GUJ93_ZPchr0009g103 [Zizania palustris]|uniref:Uncharacterized protein n=1 Tax=Zizania palustris TaxID=103762 RepID=A0A8J5RH31_ZIZPA|nr:hypothetical protein GUJ93_ZPchr0009g103 [Zizania palustris]